MKKSLLDRGIQKAEIERMNERDGINISAYFLGEKGNYHIFAGVWFDEMVYWVDVNKKTDEDDSGRTIYEDRGSVPSVEEGEAICRRIYEAGLNAIDDQIRECENTDYWYDDYSRFKTRAGYGTSDWVVYGREKGRGRYKMFTGDGFTSNVMYGMRFAPDEGDRVKAYVEQLNMYNPDYEFEARRGRGSSLFGTSDDEFEGD